LQKNPILPQDINSLLQNWTALYPFQLKKQSYASGLWRALPRFILWGLWLERNNRVFRDKQRSASLVIAKIKAFFGEWVNTHRHPPYSRELEEKEELWLGQFQIHLQTGNTVNTTTQEIWEIRARKNEFDKWKKERTDCILSFDGASKGNPGQAGGGGLIVNPNEEVLVRYAIGLGIATNNHAEAMTL
jgi:hypothetical protein